MKTKLVISIASVFGLLLPLTLIAQDEEAIVIEDLSLGELRAEIEKVENEFFRVFNLAIEQGHLKVECDDYTPTGSHIRQRACEPYFLVEARNKNLIDWQNGVDGLATVEELRTGLGKEFEELTAAMNEVLSNNDYFRELNIILRMLRERQQEIE
ncbi:MAG: hypothetical protein GKR91_08970 [Pseudomonadales bacterium]|nr:hypothetical protein [Pseudomonadales bacterium]